MQVRGITLVGTRTDARAEMATFIGEVLGLMSAPVEGMDAEMFALPDGSSFAVTSQDGPNDAVRTVGFLVDNLLEAAAELKAAGLATDEEVSSHRHADPRRGRPV